MTKPAIRPCRNRLHEYDHTRYRQCLECLRKAERKYRLTPKGKERYRKWNRKYRKNYPTMDTASCARNRLRQTLRQCGVDAADIKSANPRALLCVPSAVLDKVADGNGYADFQDVGLEVKTQRDYLSPTQWARAILNYRNGKPYRIVYIEPTPDGRDIRRHMFETVFTFYDWQQEQARLEKESAAPDADPVDTNADL